MQPPEETGPRLNRIAALLDQQITDRVEWALAWAGLGWSIVPYQVGKKAPYSTWKSFEGRRRSADEILELWGKYPLLNVAAVLGAVSDGLVVVDIDNVGRQKHPDRPDGALVYRQVVDEGRLPQLPEDTLVVKSPNGLHLYFTTPGTLPKKIGLFDSLDLLAEGQTVVLPPSSYAGLDYEVLNLAAPKPLPAEWRTYINQRRQTEPSTAGEPDQERIPLGKRNEWVRNRIWALHQNGFSREITLAAIRAQIPVSLDLSTPFDDDVEGMVAYTYEHRRRPPIPEASQPPKHEAPRVFTISEFLEESYPPPAWAVEPLFEYGCYFLIAPPKMGKSVLCLNIAIAKALGGMALGGIPVEQTPTLLLPLEDYAGRTQERLRQLIEGQEIDPTRMTLEVAPRWARDVEASVSYLHAYLERASEGKARRVCVFIDTRTAFFGQLGPADTNPGDTLYSLEYRQLRTLVDLCHDYSALVLMPFHTNKREANDVVAAYNGSNGGPAAVDGVAGIFPSDRMTGQAVLKIKDKIDWRDFTLIKDDLLYWRFGGVATNGVSGPDKPPKVTEKDRVWAALVALAGVDHIIVTVQNIADRLGWDESRHGAIRSYLSQLCNESPPRAVSNGLPRGLWTSVAS